MRSLPAPKTGAPCQPGHIPPPSDPPLLVTPVRGSHRHNRRRGELSRHAAMPGLLAYSAAGLGFLGLAASALFLLYSLAPLAAPLPLPLLDLLLAAAFAQELLLFAHRRPSTAAGIENRYFDLLLVPITLCLGATLFAAHRPGDAAPRLARAAGLALQGTWMVQMGFSFFTSAIAQGCSLHAASRADYTIKWRAIRRHTAVQWPPCAARDRWCGCVRVRPIQGEPATKGVQYGGQGGADGGGADDVTVHTGFR